jgi:hypothetical protein
MGKNICNVYILKEYIQNSKISIAKNQITWLENGQYI